MNTALESDNTSDMMSMMGGHRFFLPEKTSKFTTNDQGSLLGMATTLFHSEMRSLPPMNFSNLFPQQNMRPEDITSQVLAELADDSLFDPPSDDIFDIEPDPIAHTPVQNQEQNRLALLEDTLNQVLNINTAFSTEPVVAVSPSSSKHTIEPEMIPCAKRQRMTEEEDEDAARRFRPYQAEQWTEKFEELLEFRKTRGHCCVPHTFEENPSLARWVKRQRYQYKLKAEGKPSTMTDERIVALEQVGFVWDSHGAAWLERWQELVQFQQQYGHANVPSNHPHNPQLATWVKCQRRQYKLFWDGKPSNMNLERIQRLESVGFEWELRMSHKKK